MQFWQDFLRSPGGPPWQEHYDAPMPDGSFLRLPLRDLGEVAVAGMIANQASFSVTDRIAGWMAGLAAPWRPEVVAALPTLGHVPGAAVARALGHSNWAPLGTSRKLWYDEALSVPLASITAPGAGRRLYLDPRLLERLRGRRVLRVDDVISTGSSARAGLQVLRLAGVEPVGLAVAMAQTVRWRAAWPAEVPVAAAFSTPLFRRGEGGWVAAEA
jgi:adenine/guanine phosphoribosyltransferase-like PRPP-binding protein